MTSWIDFQIIGIAILNTFTYVLAALYYQFDKLTKGSALSNFFDEINWVKWWRYRQKIFNDNIILKQVLHKNIGQELETAYGLVKQVTSIEMPEIANQTIVRALKNRVKIQFTELEIKKSRLFWKNLFMKREPLTVILLFMGYRFCLVGTKTYKKHNEALSYLRNRLKDIQHFLRQPTVSNPHSSPIPNYKNAHLICNNC